MVFQHVAGHGSTISKLRSTVVWAQKLGLVGFGVPQQLLIRDEALVAHTALQWLFLGMDMFVDL